MSIKDKRADERPREKLQKKGAESLSDYELLMAIIGSGNAQADVGKIAQEVKKVLAIKGSNLSFEDLLSVKSLGPAKATSIMASFELWKRQFDISEKPILDSPEKAVGLLYDIRDKKQEHFVCITLDGANRYIAKRIVTIGTLSASLVHPREVFADAITDRAASIIVAHNHPSGTLSPSKSDIEVTKQLLEVAKLVGIKLNDHLIITKSSFTSVIDKMS